MSAPQRTPLAVDAGQSGIKLRWIAPGEPAPRELTLPPVLTHEPVLPQLAAAVERAAQVAGHGFGTVAVGSTGLTRAEHDAAALLALLPPEAASRVLLAHDSVTGYLGALGDAPGAVVAAGTGVVTLAVGAEAVARVDGWGHIMGDAGSGYWIGQQALIAVMRAHDGRGEATALTAPVTALFPDLEQAYIQLQASEDRVATIASLAPQVAELAYGDAVAARICRHAGRELALSVHTALRRVGAPPPSQVACLGGVFAADAVARAFAEQLEARHRGARLVAPRGSGLDGAAALAQLPSTHPLRPLLSAASR